MLAQQFQSIRQRDGVYFDSFLTFPNNNLFQLIFNILNRKRF
jgi:hypothetical protein